MVSVQARTLGGANAANTQLTSAPTVAITDTNPDRRQGGDQAPACERRDVQGRDGPYRMSGC
jgi:hypothetical protein